MEDINQLFHKDPFVQFESWYEKAKACKAIVKAEAMSIATLGLDNIPQNRTVLYKGFVDNKFSFYTNYESDKAKELEKNPFVSLLFWWDEPLELQVRIRGKAEKAPKELSDKYYFSRPKGSQIGAWASPQSQELKDEKELDHLVEEAEERFQTEELYRPEFWGGYLIEPISWDFMIMRKSRLHDRVGYEKSETGWLRKIIAP